MAAAFSGIEQTVGGGAWRLFRPLGFQGGSTLQWATLSDELGFFPT